MKIFIMGPEGSGKTVLLAMLSRYVASERQDLVLEPVDRPASQYVVAALETLEKGDWPPSTRQSTVETLQWRFGARSAPLHDITLFDAAGQDLRDILMQGSKPRPTEEHRAIRADIDAADVLVYLIDLNGFLQTKELKMRDENAWLFRTFLTTPEWQGKRRLVVLSKADIYADMFAAPPGQDGEDARVRDLVKHHLPTNYTLGHLVDDKTLASYFAVASVATTTVIDEKEGNPVRVPKFPLEPAGMGQIVDAFVKEAARIRRKRGGSVLVRRSCIVLAILSICAIALYGLLHPVPCEACGSTGTTSEPSQEQKTCSICGGRRTIPAKYFGNWWPDKCWSCRGTGVETVKTTRPVTCGACKGSGRIPWWKR